MSIHEPPLLPITPDKIKHIQKEQVLQNICCYQFVIKSHLESSEMAEIRHSSPDFHHSSSASFVPQLLKYAIFHLKTHHFDALLHLFYIAALLVYPKCTQSHFLDVSILSRMIIFRWFFIRVAAYPTMVFSYKHHSSYLLDVALSQ